MLLKAFGFHSRLSLDMFARKSQILNFNRNFNTFDFSFFNRKLRQQTWGGFSYLRTVFKIRINIRGNPKTKSSIGFRCLCATKSKLIYIDLEYERLISTQSDHQYFQGNP